VPTTNKIEIVAVELDFMKSLAKYVGSSPRRVKRLVNCYRLIKARLTDSQLDTFLKEGARSAPYQIVISLLVIGTGAPTTSAEILKELAECDPNDSIMNIVKRFYERNLPDWTMAGQVIETLMRLHTDQNVADLRGWARQVGRLLQSGQAADLRLDTIRPTGVEVAPETPPPTNGTPETNGVPEPTGTLAPESTTESGGAEG
jgi:hypothetical protein